MELLEEGNLIDRVRILVQRDADFYQQHQRVLQENICPHVVGGLLDFPHYASFAAVKLATWWESEYFNTFQIGSGLLEHPGECNDLNDEGTEVAKRVVTPTELESWVKDTAAMLLQHLHILTQEALDHADLTVLTGALGASALIKNWLWAYNTELRSRPETKISFQHSYQQYVEMSEALAERLLDLHCRLISLYVLQDASALNWEASSSFSEGERGSYPIQMWWLYIQGTKEDLWKTVPPKMAQRVLSGMLNESLVILAARYSKASSSSNRSLQLVADLGNILLCVAELLPSLYIDANILLKGGKNEKALRDTHAKCHQLFVALIFRGAPLSIIYQVFRKGMIGLRMFETPSPNDLPAWLQFTNHWLYTSGRTLPLHLSMLYYQPQPVWPLLIKVLLQENFMVSKILVKEFLPYLQGIRDISLKPDKNCGGFLCPQIGYCDSESRYSHSDAAYALTYILINCIPYTNILAQIFIEQGIKSSGEGWAHSLDRREIWTLKRPVWLTAILEPLFEILQPLVNNLSKEIKVHKRNLEELTNLALSGLASLAPCIPSWLPRTWRVLEDHLPADAEPLAGSVAFHCLIAALHSQLTLLEADALAEALCGLHSYSDSAIKQVLNNLPSSDIESEIGASSTLEIDYDAEMISNFVLENSLGRRALKVLWQWIQHNYFWLQTKLGAPHEFVIQTDEPICPPLAARPEPNSIIYTMFHIGTRPFDELLTESYKPDWLALLNLPLGLTPRQMWAHLSERSEWRSQNLNHHDATVVSAVTLCYHSLH